MSKESNEVKYLDRNPPTLSTAEVKQIARDLFKVDGEFELLFSERDQNFRVHTLDGGSLVLKISNANEEPGVVDMQVRVLSYLQQQAPDLPVPRVVRTRQGHASEIVQAADGRHHIVRMVSYLPGALMQDVIITSRLRRSLGALMARLDTALSGFFHPSGRHYHPWDLTRCADLIPYISFIPDPTTRRNVEQVLGKMGSQILPKLKKMRHQFIHQDAHRRNVILDPDQPEQIVGLIDFGDMVYGPLIAEVAVAAEAMTLDKTLTDPVRAMEDVVSGFDRMLPLEAAEVDLIYDLVLARIAASITLFEWRAAMNLDQPTHIPDEGSNLAVLSQRLAELLPLGRAQVSDRLRTACRFPPYWAAEIDANLDQDDVQMSAQRQRLLGKFVRHFYQQPLHLERGKGVYLYGSDGRAYLDCYNNVPQVGHCHPHVVRAIARQAAALNIHTRYLYRPILDYAERITSLLPPHLSACIFVNSGSEANDVALQMARFVSGNQGAVILEDGYHGITQAIRDLSPGSSVRQLPDDVAGLRAPDPYRDPIQTNGSNQPLRYAVQTDAAITALSEKGYGTAAFMIDTAFCSSGIPDVPDGYVADVAAKVRAAGGLIICDEVQAGFGRLGEMWGHVVHGVHADIVTMGKPVGNGHPLGVVVTTPEILNAFVEETGLFSTFGGNPVACAAGLAVLDVIEQEDLVSNAHEVGTYWRRQLRQLMEKQPLIGDVRGKGLLVGLEFVRDHIDKTPAVSETERIVEMMRENGVLVGSTGRNRNILKLRPPLVFQHEHVDLFVTALDQTLTAL